MPKRRASDARAGRFAGKGTAIFGSLAIALAIMLAGTPAHAQGLSDERAIEEFFERHRDLLEGQPVEPPVQAQDTSREDHLASGVTRRDRQLDRLFERLANADDEHEARGVSLLIHRRWMRSGSDTADLLMVRAQQAVRANDHALAIELLDRVLVLEPDWAEAWNRRAVTFHALGDVVAAMADIHRVLTLEPRHFTAWAGLGHIFRESGDDRGALASYERAIAINPHLPRLGPIIERLRRDIEGVDL